MKADLCRPMAAFSAVPDFDELRSSPQAIRDIVDSYTTPLLPPDFVEHPHDFVSTHRVHPQTGQVLTVIGSPVPHIPGDPEHPGYQVMGQLLDDFEDRLPDLRAVRAVTEGRTVGVFAIGRLIAGDRLPLIVPQNSRKAIRLHGELGLFAALATTYGWSQASGEAPEGDRTVSLFLEQQGYPREAIMRYCLLRQVPQWHVIAAVERPPLQDYLQRDVMDRFALRLHEPWEDFDFSVGSMIGRDELEGFQKDGGEGVELALKETIGHMIDPGPAHGEFSDTRLVALAYNMVRDESFWRAYTARWGDRSGGGHTIGVVGGTHLRALAGKFMRLGSLAGHDYANVA